MPPTSSRAVLRSPDTILVCRSPGETRSALLAGEELIEVVHRRDAEIQPGAVYLGRAGGAVPGTPAIFVEIGDARPGVLPIKGRPPAEGAAIPVLVMVPARAGKGAELKPATLNAPTTAAAPCLLRPAPEPVVEWWRCYRDGIARILCAPRREAARVKALLDARAPVAETAGADLFADPFADLGVDAAIAAALEAGVPLPCGGSLIIEATAAVMTIDINSGPADPGIANGEAVVAIAAELRRRNLAGHILVDIIPGRRRAVWPRLLADALSPDPIPAHVAGLTPLGMIELTRRRQGRSLAEVLCDAQGGFSAASVAYKLLRDAVRFAGTEKCAGVTASAAPGVVALLQGPLRAALAEAEDAIKAKIACEARADFARGRVALRRA